MDQPCLIKTNSGWKLELPASASKVWSLSISMEAAVDVTTKAANPNLKINTNRPVDDGDDDDDDTLLPLASPPIPAKQT